MKISAVVNVKNAESTIERCLQSLKWADEIVVVDNVSSDRTVELAKKYTDNVYIYETQHGYVEPIRNFAIEKAKGDWILIVDVDEEIPETLSQKLHELVNNTDFDFYQLPRKNIMFGSWFAGSGWWPDYNIRFFKKGAVNWTDAIHRPPKTEGNGSRLPAEEQYAIIHYHYESISQFMARLDRYTNVQAHELIESGYQFSWPDLLHKPLSEFLTRFFVWEGYKMGVHGLVVSLLQAVSFFVVYIKIWEKQGFTGYNPQSFAAEVANEAKVMNKELSYWNKHAQGKIGMKAKVKRILIK